MYKPNRFTLVQKRLVGAAAPKKSIPQPIEEWQRAVDDGEHPGVAHHAAVMARALNHQSEVYVPRPVPKSIDPISKQIELPMDGNQATTYIAYGLSEQAFIYPISPATSMGEHMDNWAAAKKENCFGDIPVVSMMQSEGGAAGAVHGCLTTGSMATTFTASQGLLLMIPNLYLIAGELMPCVIHVSARTLAKHSLSIFNDHGDVMACRQTGFAMLCSSSVQEAMDLALVSHIATLKARVPFMHFFDGWRTSAGIQKIKTIPYEDILKIFPYEELQENLRNRALNPNHPIIRGVGQRPDIYYQNSVAANKFYNATPGIVEEVMGEVQQLTGRKYDLIEYHGAPDADRVIIVMGSAAETCQETVDFLRETRGEKVGVIKVRLFRPWPAEHLLAAIPETVKKVCVLDRTKEDGAHGNPLFLDVCATHADVGSPRKIVGGVFGLASKEFTPGQVIALFDNLAQENPKNHFNIGIDDDVTHSSIPFSDDINIVKETTQCIFWGLGGDGTIGANKAAIKTITMDAGLYGQAYFNYDSHKENGATISHLRFGKRPIKSEYNICAGADYIACHHPSYVRKYDMLKPMKEGGIFVLNCVWSTAEELEAHFPARLKAQIAKNKVKLYTINATKMALDIGLGHRINTIMQACFYLKSGVLPIDDAIRYLKGSIKELYTKKGQKVVDANTQGVDAAASGLKEITYPASWAEADEPHFTAEGASRELFHHKNIPDGVNKQVDAFIERMMDPMLELEGDNLPVSAMTPGGYMPTATCMQEKRGLAPEVPVWEADKCTQCNYCAVVCPHAVIRPFLLDKAESKAAPESFVYRKAQGGAELGGFNYTIQLASMDCTGCAICVQSCPDDALYMAPFEEVAEKQHPNWEYAVNLPQRNPIGNSTVKGSQFSVPLLEFSGACPGCGETPYVKLLTQLFGDRLVIANSSGCSSVWGGTAGTNPYTVNKDGKGPAWGRSLFEDTAEYGFGMALSIKGRRANLKSLVEKVLQNNTPSPPLAAELTKWCKNFDSYDKVYKTVEAIEKLLPMEKDKSHEMERIYAELDMFRPPSVWIIGGDGWAYDIGYNGLDHVLSRGENINIMVLDTEMYSNTGGQASKSTSKSTVLKFAQQGKKEMKKDLGRLAMQYEHAYVASCAIGASYQQTLTAIREAEEYNGTSLLLCFSPCIDWGINMKTQMDWQKTAVDAGYWKMYRFDPRLAEKNVPPLQLDAQKIKTEKMDAILKDQNRFDQLTRKNKERADTFHEDLKRKLGESHEIYERMTMDDTDMLDYLKEKVGEQTSEKMLVLYASETGTAQNLAKEFAGELKRRDVRAKCISCNDYDIDNLPNEKQVFFIAATCGQGEFPDNSKEFWKALTEDRPADWLSGVSFSVFGLGDTGYAYFNKVAIDIDERMAALGANRIAKLGLGDDKDEEKWETAYTEWEPDQYTTLELPTPPAVLPDPTYVVTTSEEGVCEEERIMPAGATVLPLSVNKVVNPPGHDRDIRHFEIDLTGTGVSYNCGDSMGIYPWNAESRVEDFMEWYGIKPDSGINIQDPTEAGKFPIQATTPRQLFRQCLDLYGRPSRKFYERLSMIAKDSSEKAALEHLLTKEGKPDLLALGKETAGYADVMKMFPSAKPPLEYLVEFVPAIKPRLYSIASSPDYDNEMLHMCIVADDWNTPKGEYKHGLTTGYLAARGGHDGHPTSINGRVNPAAFALPSSPKQPVILVGLGTGIAPCRALIRDRLAQRDAGEEIGPMSLYFGVRYKASEYTYGEEWDALHDNGKGPLTHLHCAFSRDQAHKIYVQHRLQESEDEVYEYLVKQKGYYLLCGPGGPPVLAARAALEMAMVNKGGMSPEEANAYVTQMQIEGRYNEEVW